MSKTCLIGAIGLLLSCPGCFSEQSFPMRPDDIVRTPVSEQAAERMAVRPWLRRTHERLKSLLPACREEALLTEELVDAHGRPADVFTHFHVNPANLDRVLGNFYGLAHSAQLTGPDFSPGPPKLKWNDYQDVWVPIDDRLSLHGLLGQAKRDGAVLDADCIVILPGLLGHNDILRTRDLSDALRAHGFHVLAIELRGHGQTELRYPHVYYTFGVQETGDLMVVSEWLQSRPHIRRTGLVGFCWGANEALLAAWYDARRETHPSIQERLRTRLRPPSERRHFDAGVISFSPVMRIEELTEALKTPWTSWQHPAWASLQGTVLERMLRKVHSNPSGDLDRLIGDELARSDLNYPGTLDDAYDFVRMLPHKGRIDGDKLKECRMPVLIVQAANDPLAPAQALAELFAREKNPNLAGIILPGGGHVGFAAYCRAYYFSLIVNFFDPNRGPIAAPIVKTGPS